MNKYIIVFCAAIVLNSCTENTNSNTIDRNTAKHSMADAHNSQNALDWAGVYEGTTPCADCPGIKTSIQLNYNNTFSYKAEYLERNTVLEDSGSIMWHDNGSIVHLKANSVNVKYIVGENILIQLDGDGNKIEGPLSAQFNLKKVQ